MPQFKMPELGESVTEGIITGWLKKEGDPVEADEALVEVSTDKVDSEIPAPHAGILTKILVQEGETVPVGAALAEITAADESAPAPAPAAAGEAVTSGSETPSADTGAGPASGRPVPADLARTDDAARQPDAAPGQKERTPAPRVFSPLVRRLAARANVDLAGIEGTGTGGRVTREDVLRHAGDGNGAGAGSVRPPAAAASQGSAPGPAIPSGESTASTLSNTGGADERVPLTNMRRLIAEHMVASVNETARAWNTVEVDMTAVGRLRKAAAASFKRTFNYSLTWTPFVARALTQALLEYPQVNSSWNGDNTITKKHYVNLGIAVALENGLIVPVIKGADQMNLLGLSSAIRDLAQRARNKKLSADEIQEGTFTLTNPGPFGSIMSVPIINRGQAAILAFDSIVKRPVVITAPDGTDSIAIREMVYLSLSWDHRLIDGAEAAQFLARLKAILEQADFEDDLAGHL